MINKSLRPWKTLDKKVILASNKFLTVENHTVELPDGQIIPDWAWLTIPSAAIVIAITDDQEFLCFRQTKYAVEGTTLAPVGGMLETGESPLEGARRELLEEMGYNASEWVNLGGYILDPNRGIATMHLFLALHARQVTDPHSDDLEDQQGLRLSRQEIENALQAGEFKVLAWTAAVALALNYIDRLDS